MGQHRALVPVLLVVALVGLSGCALLEPAPTVQVPKVTGDVVFVQFFGSAQIEDKHASAAGAYASFEWQELDECPIGSSNLVQTPRCIDHLSGVGTAWAVSYAGSCTARYAAPETSLGTTQGIRIENVGTEVQAIGAGPWSLAQAKDLSGGGCPQNQNGDPTGRLLDRLVNTTDFNCVMTRNSSCEKLAQVPPSGDPLITQTGRVVFRAWRQDKIEFRSVIDPDFQAELEFENDLWDDVEDALDWLVVLQEVITEAQEGKNPDQPENLTTQPAPATGGVTIDASDNGNQLVQFQGTARKGSTMLDLMSQWNLSSVRALGAISSPIALDVTVSYAAPGGPPFTLTQTVYLAAAGGGSTGGAAPTISGVAFHGSPSGPTIVVTGQNFGSEPAPDPASHPSGQNGCPTVAGDQGYDYGIALYIAFSGGTWSAGRYRPELNETDCIDLVVIKFTSTEVDLAIGGLYSQQTKNIAVAGTPYQVTVNGASQNGTVAYS